MTFPRRTHLVGYRHDCYVAPPRRCAEGVRRVCGGCAKGVRRVWDGCGKGVRRV